jgi:hypothetical protein
MNTSISFRASSAVNDDTSAALVSTAAPTLGEIDRIANDRANPGIETNRRQDRGKHGIIAGNLI